MFVCLPSMLIFVVVAILLQVCEADEMDAVPLGRAEGQNGIVASEPNGSKLWESDD